MSNFSKVLSAELEGVEARLIEVETDIRVGLHNFTIVGLADKALNEAKERVNSALKNVDVKQPSRENRRIVVNLAPADIKKTGSQYDLPIAIGYLLANDQIASFDTTNKLFAGELSLDGQLRPIAGALSMARLAKRLAITELILPAENAAEAAIIPGVRVTPVKNLTELVQHLEERAPLASQAETQVAEGDDSPFVDISDIKGQESAKRALMIAAAGGHNLLMSGPPGTGKTMLAQALASILPPPTLDEIIEITQIYSAAGLLKEKPFINYRPFRSPHQTASPVSIIGGGTSPKPGEISLAHRGVLFLDEAPEFRRDLLEALRQPMESGRVVVTRIKNNLVFPASFILVAAMNPCPCGFYGDEEKACQCNMHEILRYQKKISGPLLDRIDIQIDVPRVKVAELRKGGKGASETKEIREKVLAARKRQTERLKKVTHKRRPVLTNAELSSREVDQLIELEPEAEEFIKSVFDKSLVSARGYYRILKTARTIADLADAEKVKKEHLKEAFSYRVKEKNNINEQRNFTN